MSTTATTPEHSHAPYAEPDEFIDYQLRKTQAGIKRTDMITAGVVSAAVLIGYLLLFVICDHWLFVGGLSPTARLLMWLPMVGTIGWLIGTKLIWPALRNVSGLFAAKTLESSAPEFRSTLLSLIDLKRSARPVSPAILATMEKRVAVTFTKFNVDDAIDKRLLLRTMYVLFGLVVAFCLYTVLSPKKLGPSVVRAILPFSDVHPATQTEILEVKPGDAKLRAGDTLPIDVLLRGDKLPTGVRLYFTTADRRFVAEPFDLSPTTEPQRFEGIFGQDGQGLLQDFTYYIVAGDARSSEYRVDVVAPPSATVTDVRYEYPPYMELDATTRLGGAIDVWERTSVKITAATNIPVEKAECELSDTEDFAPGATYPGPSPTLDDTGKQLTIQWRADPRQAGVVVSGQPPQSAFPKFYRIQVVDSEGNRDPKPAVYPINVRVDQPPTVALLDPTTNREVPANGIVPLAVTASDPDFKLRRVILKIARDENDITDEMLFEGAKQEVSLRHDFALESLRLKAGDKFRFWIEAQDNRLPAHNEAKTAALEITIKDRVSKDEAKQQLADQKQQQELRLNNENAVGKNEQPTEPDAPRNDPQDDQQEKSPIEQRIVMSVRLFDEQTNREISVRDYAKAFGFRQGDPLFRGFVMSDFDASGSWVVSSAKTQDGARRAIAPPRQKLTIRQEIRQQVLAEALDPGVLHALPVYGDCRLDPAHRATVQQGSVNSVLYRREPLGDGTETKYVVYSVAPDKLENLPFPQATLDTELTVKDRVFYCRLPEGVNGLKRFARQTAANEDGSLPRPVEIAKRLLARLSKRDFSYNTNITPGVPRCDTAEAFVLKTRRGDCKDFNSALALMLREFAIPSRMILGFKGGQAENGEFIVKTPGHAWVEAYIDGHWLVLDATKAMTGTTGEQQQLAQADDQNPPPDQPQNDQQQAENPQQNDQQQNGQKGATKKQQPGQGNQAGAEKKQQSDPSQQGKPAGDQSLKDDGSDDDRALQKIANRAKEKGQLPKPKSTSSPGEDSANDNENKNPKTDQPKSDGADDSNQPNANDKPNESEDKPGKQSSTDQPQKAGSPKKPEDSANGDDPNGADPGDKPKPNGDATDKPQDSNDNKDSSKPGQPKREKSEADNSGKKQPGDDSNSGDDSQSNKPGDKSDDGGDQSNNEKRPGDKKNTDSEKSTSKSDDGTTGDKSPMPGDDGDKSKPGSSKNDKSDDKPSNSDKPDGDPKADDASKSKNPKNQAGRDGDEPSKPEDGTDDPNGKKSPVKSADDGKQPGQEESPDKPNDPNSAKKPRRGNPDKRDPADKGNDAKQDSADAKEGTDDKQAADDQKSPDGKKEGSGQKDKDGQKDGSGEKSDDGGDSKSKSDQGEKSSDSGKSGKKPGDGKQQPSDDDSAASEDGGKPSDKKQPGSGKAKQGESSKSKSSKAGPAAGGKPGAGTPGQATSDAGGPADDKEGDPKLKQQKSSDSDSGSGESESANEEFTKEAANLVLKRLQKELQRGEVDRELLDELGWTEEQMQKFLERMGQNLEDDPDDNSPAAKARRRQFEEMLRNLDLTSKQQRRDDTNQDKSTGDGAGSVRRPPPPHLREVWEAYTKGRAKKRPEEPAKR